MNIEAMMALAGTNDDEDIETQLNKIAQLFTPILNQYPCLKMDGYTWKLEYVNDGLDTKFSKMDGDTVVSWVTVNNYSMEPTFSDANDKDLKKIVSYMALGSLM